MADTADEGSWPERIAALEEGVRDALSQEQTVEFQIQAVQERLQKQAEARKHAAEDLETLREKLHDLLELAKAQRASEEAEDRRVDDATKACAGLARSIKRLRDTCVRGEAKVQSAEANVERQRTALVNGKGRTLRLQDALVGTGEAKEPLTAELDAEREKQRLIKVQMEGKIARMREDFRDKHEASQAAARRTAQIRGQHADAEASLEDTRASLTQASEELATAETACRTKQREKDMWRTSLREVRRANERLRAEFREVGEKVVQYEHARDDDIKARCQAHLEKLDNKLAARALAEAQPLTAGPLA